MKKTILSLVAMCVMLCACQKEQNAKSFAANPKLTVSKQSLTGNPTYSYVDLTLQARAPGENFDTYHCSWLGVDLYVTGVFWDSTTYPTLYTGVPLYGTVSTGTSSYNTISDASANGTEGTAFVVSLPTLCGVPNTKYTLDINSFESALDSWNFQGTPPFLNYYVSTNYGTANCPQTKYQLKLIRCTTGSGYGVATSDYPATYVSKGTPSTTLFETDPLNSSILYDISGVKGILTSCVINGSSTSVAITGAYTQVTPGSSSFHIIGTITRADGSTFSFNDTQDPS